MRTPFLLLYLFFWCAAPAQNPFCINYSINDGLPSENVYAVFEDQNGFIWLTTDAGIVRFDSHNFLDFNTDNGLSDNEVFQMKKDHKGRIWLLTLNGKTCYIQNGKIYNETNSALVRKICGNSLMSDFYQDAQNQIYFCFRDGQIVQVTPHDKVVKIKCKTPQPYLGMWKNKNKLCVLTPLGIYNAEQNLRINPMATATTSRAFHVNRQTYISNANQLYRIRPNGDLTKILSLPEPAEILQLYQENPNKIWICTRQGLFLHENQQFKKYFSGEMVSNLLRDFEGGYWVATLKNGVYYVPSFDVILNKLSTEKPMKINCIGINQKKEIWAGGDANNYFVKRPGLEFTGQTTLVDGQADQITSIRFFGQDTYVSGKNMILKIDGKGKKSFLGCGANDLWLDAENGFFAYTVVYKIPHRKIKPGIKNMLNKNNMLLQKRTSVLLHESENTWIGSNYGLYRYRVKDSITNWNSYPNLQTSIEDLYFDSKQQTLFVATSSKGIVLLRNEKIIGQISHRNGLNSMTCNAIEKVGNQTYLVGSNNGLNLVTFKNESVNIRNINAVLGLKNQKINDIGYLDQIVYLATDRGLLWFNITKINRKDSRPKCLIETLKTQKRNAAGKPPYEFDFNDNQVSIHFSGISYISQNDLTYHYQLSGQDWTQTQESQINYKSLPSGEYIFKVYCTDGYGTQSNTAVIRFEILAPFWQKWWFILLCLLIIIGVIYAIVKYRLKEQQRQFSVEKAAIQLERDKATLEKQMIDLEQKALRQQMNPHFIFNALNTIKGYYSEGDLMRASTYISKFSKLLRMLLENADKTISLSTEIEMLELYLELTKIRYENKFVYELILDENLNPNDIEIPTLLLQPIVENAIIHGLSPRNKTGLLKISFAKQDKQLHCMVEDNGIGRIASQKKQQHREYQSKALEITKERIALFSKGIGPSTFEIIDLIQNDKPAGTQVVVTIPLISIWS
ncbi:hypothetical protein G4D82_13125 [Flavobacterium sp. CYK-4]|uniref:sensor histidine kinase n=1 Tax=Flavobacterium lotistagni TaxID=2709660 RepID=UPI00140E1C83|nr:sensor histidine kinase [Flavobacterium lotistagni]NHM08168.1 hypothetical protein [Flavobacterium lotistagni]